MEQIISLVIFFIVIIAIVSEKVNRVAAAISGAVLLMITHILSVEKAVSYIDFNTIGVLIGMMIFVSIVKASGIFEYIAIKSAKMAKGNPWKIMMLFMIITAILSAFLDNVTTVLLIGPMTIAIANMLGLDPIPFLISQILASNIGGTGTLIGDPPNIMIGSAAKFSFLDFIINTTPPIVVIMIVFIFVIKLLYGRKLIVKQNAIDMVMQLDEKKAIINRKLLIKSIIAIIFVVAGFMFHSIIHLESSVIALTAGSIMLIFGGEDAEKIIHEVEWSTILFFTGLFIVVGGLVETGVVDKLAELTISATDGKLILTMIVLLWASAILSSILDNIPFVATLIPLILAMEKNGINVTPLWWAMSLGACLGGNGTLIGASANVVLSGISAKHGHPISFRHFLKVGFPIMILTISFATIYLVLRFGVI